MLFQKKTGYHALLLYIQNEEPSPMLVVMPNDVANDVLSTMKKFEKSALNDPAFIGNWGPMTIVQDIQGFKKIEIHNDSLPWGEPLLYTDYAKGISERLQEHMDDDAEDVEEDLVYFIGEFTMMQDNGFVAPF
jgi:hypothetical protein